MRRSAQNQRRQQQQQNRSLAGMQLKNELNMDKVVTIRTLLVDIAAFVKGWVGPPGLSKNLSIFEAEDQSFIDDYLMRFMRGDLSIWCDSSGGSARK